MSEKFQKINLRDHGYHTSGKNGGDPSVLKAELNSVLQGKIIDSTIDDILSEEERSRKQTEINGLKNEISGITVSISNMNDLIEKKKVLKDKIQEEIDAIRLGKEVNNEPSEAFSWMKLWINLFFLVPLSIYLFLFYVATIYKAFYFEATTVAEGSDGIISALPAPGELSDALSYNYLLLFAPFLFFGFGYAVHVLLELKSKLKYVYVFLVLAVTFILDFLLAFKIHKINADAQSIISDEAPIALVEDSNFYIILFMGFVVYIIWSILLNASINEWKKRNIIGRRVVKINQLDKDIDGATEKIASLQTEIKLKESTIDHLNDEIKGVKIPVDKLKFCLSELYAGWLAFITGSSVLTEKKNPCEEVYNNFLIDNNLSN